MPENGTLAPADELENATSPIPISDSPVESQGNETNSSNFAGGEGYIDPGPYLAEESPYKPEGERARKTIGRPPKAPPMSSKAIREAVASRPIPIALPRPKYTVYRSDAPNQAQKSNSAWNYWNDLPGWAKDRTLAYIYRDWPILKAIPEESREFAYIDKISGNEPIQNDNDFLHRYGCGSYKISFNDIQGSQLCIIYVAGVGGSDLKSFPPSDRRVSDVAQVDLDRKENNAYVEFLRMRGNLPDQTKKAEKEAEMASVQTIDRMATANEKLTDKLLDFAKDSNKRVEQPTGGISVGESVRAVNEAWKEVVTTVRTELGNRGGGESTAELLNVAMSLAEKLAGQRIADPATTSEIADLRRQVSEMNEARFKLLEGLIKDKNNTPVAPSPFSSMKEGVAALKEFKGMVDEFGGQENKPSPVSEVVEGMDVPPWLKATLQYGLPIVGQVLGAILQQRSVGGGQGVTQQPGVPMPQAYPPPPPPPGNGMGNGNVVQMPPPQIAAPTPTFTPPAADPNANQNADTVPPEVLTLLAAIHIPFVQNVNAGVSGGDFADWFVGGFGEGVFKDVQAFGKDSLLGAVYGFAPIVGSLDALKIGKERVEKFVGEFVVADPMADDGEPGA